MAKATPPPWRYEPDGPLIRGPYGYALALLYIPDPDASDADIRAEIDANGTQMAATHELLAACQKALDFHSLSTEAFVRRYGPGMTTRVLCDALRAAIAKARPHAKEEQP
jgi:hypothetical protein